MKRIYILLLISGYLFQSLIAQTPEQLKSWLPDIDGWTIPEEMEVFDADNLFNRINGAAPLFIENNFKEMTSLSYVKGDDYITIQAYRHETPEDAFGMYSSERSSGLNFYPVGAEGQGDDASIYFFAGHMYVKIWATSSDNVGEILRKIASGLAGKIDPEASYPAVIKLFPRENMVPYTETYITSNYIGHEFLKGVYAAKYKKEDKVFQVFVIDGKTKEAAKDILTKYFTFTKQPLDFQEGFLVIKDRFNGDIPVVWVGSYVVGVFPEDGGEIKNVQGFLEEIADKVVILK